MSFPYLAHGLRELCKDVIDLDESAFAYHSKYHLVYFMIRYLEYELKFIHYPREIVERVVYFLYTKLWTKYIIDDAIQHNWAIDDANKTLSLYPPFQKGLFYYRKFIRIYHYEEKKWYLARDCIFVTSIRQNGRLMSNTMHREMMRLRYTRTGAYSGELNNCQVIHKQRDREQMAEDGFLYRFLSTLLCWVAFRENG